MKCRHVRIALAAWGLIALAGCGSTTATKSPKTAAPSPEVLATFDSTSTTTSIPLSKQATVTVTGTVEAIAGATGVCQLTVDLVSDTGADDTFTLTAPTSTQTFVLAPGNWTVGMDTVNEPSALENCDPSTLDVTVTAPQGS